MEYQEVFKCNCGAVTVTIDNENYAMPRKTFNELFGKHRISLSVYGCDHCVNKWGIDLCDCGSGEQFQECKEGHSCCGTPSQILGEKKVRIFQWG